MLHKAPIDNVLRHTTAAPAIYHTHNDPSPRWRQEGHQKDPEEREDGDSEGDGCLQSPEDTIDRTDPRTIGCSDVHHQHGEWDA